jgi:phage virion morphogenesis protein
MSVSLTVHLRELDTIAQRVSSLAAFDKNAVLHAVGAEVESQTRRRISTEKTAPDGTPWPDWSRRYANTRHGGHSLLMNHGDLHDSLQSLVDGDQVETGSNLAYAALHNFGGDVTRKSRTQTLFFRYNARTGEVGNRFVKKAKANFAQTVHIGESQFSMPQRQYLGLSDDNQHDLTEVVLTALNQQLARAFSP